ncbi:MAG: hypothetical protein GPOALKHO_000633 [Sodalis sp.]|uniref:hypothetical protein n=1 Tax=Sodalis sp. (in: enterobacteria) TaxID=1898979 RepID=UPI003872E283|nr:MAG: hypothetical protein GPOALKHO_000633 [Sodalis sp.]
MCAFPVSALEDDIILHSYITMHVAGRLVRYDYCQTDLDRAGVAVVHAPYRPMTRLTELPCNLPMTQVARINGPLFFAAAERIFTELSAIDYEDKYLIFNLMSSRCSMQAACRLLCGLQQIVRNQLCW